MLVSAAAETADRGWSGPTALAVAALSIYLIWRFDKWRQGRKLPSPAGRAAPSPYETPQVTAVSSHVSRDETPVARKGGADNGHWYGSIEQVRGGFKRVYRNAAHIAQTGKTPAPQAYGDEPHGAGVPDDPSEVPDDPSPFVPDDVLDLPLDDDFGGALELPRAGDDSNYVPVEPARRFKLTREQYIARCRREKVDKALIVEGLQEHYGRSRAQAYRDAA